MPVPTPETVRINTLLSIGAIIYYTLLLGTFIFLVSIVCLKIRDWIRAMKARRYEQEEGPVEWILDYPGFAMGEYGSEKKDDD